MSLFNFVKSSLSILDVVSSYTNLKPAGSYYKSTCPFHSEKDGSFTVSPDKQIFYCFGCQEGGDMISFIAKIENLSQLQAAQYLVEKYKLSLPKELSEEFASQKNNKTNFYNVCSLITNWLALELENSQPAKKYLEKRFVNQEMCSYFEIGFFPGGTRSVNKLIRDMSKQNVLLSDLLEVGVLMQSGKSCYSPYEDRIIFPIKDSMGRHCGFGGRIFKPSDQRAKYYNSKDSPYFKKGELVFGMDLAKDQMRKLGNVFLVEGYSDCVLMVKHGYKNTVATLGTACTEQHLRLLARYVDTVYVLYDGDSAGQKAILRLVELCWGSNLELKIVRLPVGEDPASLLGSGGNLERLVAGASDIFSFFVEAQGKGFRGKALADKMDVSSKIVEVISKIDDRFKQDLLMQKAANMLQIPLDFLVPLRNRYRSQPDGVRRRPEVQSEDQELEDAIEKRILFAIINNIDRIQEYNIDEDLLPYFSPLTGLYLEKLRNCAEVLEQSRFTSFFSSLDEEQKRWVSFNCLKFGQEVTTSLFKELLMQLRKSKWRDKVEELKSKMLQAKKDRDMDRLKSATEQFSKLKEEMRSKGLI